MADQTEVRATYDPMDALHLAALGEYADVSGALYDSDFSPTLEEAQRRKHELVLSTLGLAAGDTFLDIGCGWGPLLHAARERGIRGVGITLSPAQVRRCRKNGVDVRLLDWKDIDAAAWGTVDGVASLGAFEHFVSSTEMLEGRQEEIYRDFFRRCAALLPDDGKLFLQTMTWGDRVPDPDELDVNAPKLSDAWVMGHLAHLYPGSWLPTGLDQVVTCANPWFRLQLAQDSREDYIQTQLEWKRAGDALGVRKWLKVLPLLIASLSSRHAWRYLTALRWGCNRLCFERKIFSHYRTVFSKV